MPNKDKTGPFGEGPLTGRSLGACGSGRGFGRRFSVENQNLELSKEQKKKILEKEKSEIDKKLKELEE